MNHLFQRFKRDIVGIVWMAVGLFLGLALFSYRATDPSFNSTGKGLTAQNYCGYFGSFLSDAMYQLMGLVAWITVLAAIRLAIQCFAGKEVKLKGLRFLWVILLIVTSASLAALYFPESRFFSDQIRVGGLIGMAFSSGLVKVFNFMGATILLWSIALVLLVFYTEKTVTDLFMLPKRGFLWLKKHAPQEINILPAIAKGGEMLKSLGAQEPLSATAGPAQYVEAPEKKFVLKGAEERARFFSISPTENDEGGEEKKIMATDEGPAVVDEEAFNGSTEESAPEVREKRRVKLKAKIQRHVENWALPKISLLEDPPATRTKLDEKEIKTKASLLTDKLAQFGVRGDVVGIRPGPAVTMFEFKPAADVKISKITDLADDLSLALSSESVRIVAPIPGRNVVGIETSNTHRETVYLKDIIADEEFWSEDCRLPIALGRQANGETKIVDLRKMPHLLVAGTTGSGKSVFVVSALIGLLFRHSPKTLRLILVDPKQVDLAAFSEVPHLIMPPIREPRKAVGALRWAIREMEKRYRSMSKFGARGLESFNEIVGRLSTEEIVSHEKANEPNEQGVAPLESYYYSSQPYICIVVEEFGDLMSVDKMNVEQSVVRLAQMARACGIHLILAMQSPRKDVITGLIKTNIPGRASFKVASKMDSRIILDESGAERLLARGDMLFLAPGVSKPGRHHAPYLSEEEITGVVRSWRNQGEPEYDSLAMRAIEGSGGGFELGSSEGGVGTSFDEGEIKDERYDEVLAYVSTQREISASLLQRRFRLGYPRAARMIEIFETEGVVGPSNGSKPRQVLIKELK